MNALAKRFRQWLENRHAEAKIDDAVFRGIELSIDQLIRRGEVTPENIKQVVTEITDLYYPKKTKKDPPEGGNR